jgi:hypothetical protein
MPPRKNVATGSNTVELGNGENNHVENEMNEVPVQGAVNPDAAQLLAAAARLVEVMANAQVHERRSEERGCSFRDFSGHTFPTFDGTEGSSKQRIG